MQVQWLLLRHRLLQVQRLLLQQTMLLQHSLLGLRTLLLLALALPPGLKSAPLPGAQMEPYWRQQPSTMAWPAAWPAAAVAPVGQLRWR